MMKLRNRRKYLLAAVSALSTVLLAAAVPAEETVTEDAAEVMTEAPDQELAGLVKATRTYTIQNAMDGTVAELYVYPTEAEDKGENLAGDGLVRGEQVLYASN